MKMGNNGHLRYIYFFIYLFSIYRFRGFPTTQIIPSPVLETLPHLRFESATRCVISSDPLPISSLLYSTYLRTLYISWLSFVGHKCLYVVEHLDYNYIARISFVCVHGRFDDVWQRQKVLNTNFSITRMSTLIRNSPHMPEMGFRINTFDKETGQCSFI